MPSNNRADKIRKEILIQCFGYRPNSRDSERMARTCNMDGGLGNDPLPVTAPEIDREAAFLIGSGWIELVKDGMSGNHPRYKITSDGILYAEEWALV